MHRIQYTDLTPEQIGSALAAAKAPVSATPLCGCLAGKKLRIATTSDCTLDLEFFDDKELSVSENGAPAVRCAYAAKTLAGVTLFVFNLPRTLRVFAVALDNGTGRVTVYDTFFGGEVKMAREVQREYYFGYVDEGRGVPEKLHTLTNRFEGKGFFWKDDAGREWLEFYPSVMYSSTVLLYGKYQGMTYCAPTDYIKISEDMLLTAKVEAEFSGMMTLKLVDMFNVRSIGLRLGFDENDAFHFEMFEAEGKITGQTASFAPFNDYGEKIVRAGSLVSNDGKYKGFRPVYRPMSLFPPMSEEEVVKAAQEHTEPFGAKASIMGGSNSEGSKKLPLSDMLAGKKLTVRYDEGPCWEYEFIDGRRLKVRAEGEAEWHEEPYECFEVAENMALFGHLLQWQTPAPSNSIALDFSNDLTTCLYADFGNEFAGNEVNEKMLFGVIEGEGHNPPKYVRHHQTDELVGKSFAWNYSDAMSSVHVYSSPSSYSWTIMLPNGDGGMMWSSVCLYGKLRDDTYMISWVEEGCGGSLGVLVFNTRTMHDCGFFYGVGRKDGVHYRSFGAYARPCGKFNIKKYLQLKP